jgi:CxxC-x17-CxxC domain-containing protein
MSFQDKTLTCQDCNSPFTFGADDQQYHAEKGYTNEPKRCPSCRSNRRAGGSGGGYSSGSSYGSSYASGYGGTREMHPATCAQCGKSTQVPFLPRGDRPVYCSDCFSKQPQSASRRY